MVEIVVILRVEREVQDSDDVHGFQTIVPLSFFSLFADGECGVVETPVFEKLLFAALHFHQDFLAAFVFAIHVEYRPAVTFPSAYVFRVQVGERVDFLPPLQQAVDEADEQILVHLCPEQFLESEIRIGVYIAVW